MAAQAGVGKLIALVGQVILARMLIRDDWGLIAMAYTVSAFANIIQQTGQREILIQRNRRFERWASTAFWMSMTSGLANSLVMAAAAPIAVWFYGRRELLGLVLILSSWPVLNAAITLPTAILQNQLRFRAIAGVYTFYGAGMLAFNILFAWMKMGAYSFALPWPIMGVLRVALMWWLAPHRVSLWPRFARWRYLLGTSAAVFAGRAALVLVSQADFMMLGRFYRDDNSVVGVYFFAFNLSVLTIALLTTNLEAVLFPVLSKSQDPQRQRFSTVNAAELLAVVAVPACFLQAGVADSLLQSVFRPEAWYAAKWPLIILSVGMAFRAVGLPTQSLIQAQGRFRTFMLLNVIGAATFLAMVAGGAWAGYYWLRGEVTVAIAASIYCAGEGLADIYVAIRPQGGRWRDIRTVFFVPTLAGAGAVAIGFGVSLLLPGGNALMHMLRMAIVCVVSLAVYAPAIRLLAPATWNSLVARVVSLRHKPSPCAPSNEVQTEAQSASA